VAIARVIWQKTTVSMDWIATRLEMKSAANASQQLRRPSIATNRLPTTLQRWLLSENVA
jgi:putative transposase